ncbi:hypothetical protein TNCV_1792241 [Trichonephila clavipes]|nr:hypothetical protein TNCV_1792241 [Trichonephila clavipes]
MTFPRLWRSSISHRAEHLRNVTLAVQITDYANNKSCTQWLPIPSHQRQDIASVAEWPWLRTYRPVVSLSPGATEDSPC